jgi:acyl-coenzyme A thioesterase PaaI-like protein
MSQSDSPGAKLLSAWRRLSPLPGGHWLFTQLVKWMIPYTGSVSPRVETLEPGFARISITQRRRLEQHLGSIHAIALMNVAEFASGAAMTTALPPGYRGIVTKMTIEYFKKARGTVTAESRPNLPDLTVEGEYDFISEITDQKGDLIARATVRWKLGPIPAKDAASSQARATP